LAFGFVDHGRQQIALFLHRKSPGDIAHRREALGITAAGSVDVCEFVDQRDLRPTRDERIEVHLLDDLVPVFEPLARDDFEAPQQRFGFGPPVGLDHADHHFDAGFQPNMRALQHLIGLADARRAPTKILSRPTRPSSRRAASSRASGEGHCMGSRRCWAIRHRRSWSFLF
jgi:hypothetical protein